MACSGRDLLLSVKDWHYRAEGNASFVIFNPATRTILKLRKRCTSKESVFKVIVDDLQPFQGFIETVIAPLLGTEYICLSTVTPVNRAFLETVARYFEPQRPEKRLHKRVDVGKKYALSLPDFCFLPSPDELKSQGPTFCIELKPKRGFLPVLGQIPDDLAIKYSVCRYCLLQQHKVEQGIWEKRSHYCPLDLFSCDPARMKYSLNMLLENPQNNLRIFKDGVAIYHVQEKSTPSEAERNELVGHLGGYFGEDWVGEEKVPGGPLQSSCVQSFLDVIIQALMSSSTKNGIKQRVAHANRSTHGPQSCAESGYNRVYKDKYSTDVSTKPSDHCILRRLLASQSLNVLEIDVILPLYQKVLQYLKMHPQDSEKYRLDFPYDVDFLSAEEVNLRHLANLQNGQSNGTRDVSGVSVDDAVRLIREYLITRTLQDCSIMLAVQLVTQEISGSVVQSPQGRRYLYSASVVDLDPKPSSKIPTYESLDRKIAQGYVRRHQNGIVPGSNPPEPRQVSH